MRDLPQLLRVAVVASSLKLAGAEKQTVYMARALFEAGIDARFYSLGEGGHYEAVLRQIGIPLFRIYRPNRPLLILSGLIKALCRFRPQIVLVPQFGDLLQGGIAGRFCNALTLGGLRSDGFYELNSSGWRSRWMLGLTHGLLANSHCGRKNLASQGADPQKIRILPNVLDLHDFDARSALPLGLSIPSDRVVAAAVGSLLPCKRFDRFLDALALGRLNAPSLFGVIAGADRGCRPALEERAIELGLTPDHVRFLGECDNVPALLARAGFLVLCSEYEGFPNVILEAMGARLPVITTAVGDAHVVVQHQETGYVVDGTNLKDMAARMVQLARSPETRMQFGTEGRKRVVQEYNYGTLPLRLLSVFRDCAAQHRKYQLVARLQGWLEVTESNRVPASLLSGEPGCVKQEEQSANNS